MKKLGKLGAKALKKLQRKLDALAKKIERLPEKKMTAALRDALLANARAARAAAS